MGSKYKKELEKEWDGMILRNVKVKTMQIRADKNLTRVCRDKLRRRSRKYGN